jgi:hypothetical protein
MKPGRHDKLPSQSNDPEELTMMNTQLLHRLPAEQARCRELVRKYVSIGSAGAFASALIEASLRRADRAVIEGDESDISRALDELQAYEGSRREPLRLAA